MSSSTLSRRGKKKRKEQPPLTRQQIDTNRIIRPDYADPAYAALAQTAQNLWRNSEWGADGRYSESGLCLTAEAGREDYVTKSLSNVRALNALQREQEQHSQNGSDVNRSGNAPTKDKAIKVLRSNAEIRRITRTGGASGTSGYLNPSSGWADAEAAMRYLHQLVLSVNRVNFVTARVIRLSINHHTSAATGALLSTGETLTADLTLVAAGAWTPSLLDLRGIASATGQVLAYLDLSPQEQADLAGGPVQLNMSTGLFVIPPHNRVLKVARHGYGYVNPVRIPHPEDPEGEVWGEKDIVVSLPRTKQDDPGLWIPREGEEACRRALRELVPSVAERGFSYSRICWYTDTPRGDFLITYHPRYGRSLFVATGGMSAQCEGCRKTEDSCSYY